VETGRLLTTSEQSEGATGERAFFTAKRRTEAEARDTASIVGVGTRVLAQRGVHKAQTDVVHLVYEDREACVLGTADEAHPADNARYMYIDNGALAAVVSYCVHRRGEGERWTRYKGVKERQARLRAGAVAREAESERASVG
jgi:hypothetical protein